MVKKFGALLGLLGLPGDLDTFLKFIGISSGTGILSGYLQFASGGSIAWIFMFALAGAAFMMMILYFYFLARGLLSVFGRVSVDKIAVIQAGFEDLDGDRPVIHALTLRVDLHNHSDQIVYFKIQRALLTMSGLVRPDATVTQTVEIVQAHSTQGFLLPTLPDVPIPTNRVAPKGSVELEILYGTSKDNLPYLFTYLGEPQIAFQINKEKGEAQLTITTAIKALSHRRQGWIA